MFTNGEICIYSFFMATGSQVESFHMFTFGRDKLQRDSQLLWRGTFYRSVLLRKFGFPSIHDSFTFLIVGSLFSQCFVKQQSLLRKKSGGIFT